MAAETVNPNSIPIGGCGQKGQPACPPIICIKIADGSTIQFTGAVHISIAPDPEQPVDQTGVESNTA